jgi:hypothetical protein
MSKEIDSFLSNECMKAIIELSINNPNDMDLGKVVRKFIHSSKKQSNRTQTKPPSTQPNMGDVDEH